MGNWRTVRIVGSCPPEQVEALREACRFYSYGDAKRREREEAMDVGEAMGATHPLAISGGLAGLGDWPAEVMDVGGNLFERNFDVEDVAKTLNDLAVVAPGLEVKVHCGDDYESEKCVATITLKEGSATIGEPEVKTVDGVAEVEMASRLWGVIRRPT